MGSEALVGVFGAGFGAYTGCNSGGGSFGAPICTQRDPYFLQCPKAPAGGGGGGGGSAAASCCSDADCGPACGCGGVGGGGGGGCAGAAGASTGTAPAGNARLGVVGEAAAGNAWLCEAGNAWLAVFCGGAFTGTSLEDEACAPSWASGGGWWVLGSALGLQSRVPPRRISERSSSLASIRSIWMLSWCTRHSGADR